MGNSVELILEILYINKSEYKDLDIKVCSLKNIIEQDFNAKIFAICMCESNSWIDDEFYIEINDLNNFNYNEQDINNVVIDEMFEFNNNLDPKYYSFLAIKTHSELLSTFEKDYNDTVKIYNSLNLNERKKFLSNNLLANDQVLYNFQTTYFEVLTTPRNLKFKKFLKDNNYKIDFEKLILK